MGTATSILLGQKTQNSSHISNDENNDILSLPVEITLGILSRLSVDSVLECRRVCKAWRTLLLDNHFADMHLRGQLMEFDYRPHSNNPEADTKISFLCLSLLEKESRSGETYSLGKLFYVEYDDKTEQSFYKTVLASNRIFDKQPPHPYTMNCSIAGSCNGLVCFSLFHYRYGAFNINYDPLYICNPVTREYVYLPRFNIDGISKKATEAVSRIVTGFGYHPSTKEYKVVRIYYERRCVDEPPVGRIQVYTLGDGNGWRNKGETNYWLMPGFEPLPGILFNGALHWLADRTKIVIFDLAQEEFRLLQSPPCFNNSYVGYQNCELRILGGSLCLVLYENNHHIIHIWSLKEEEYISYDMKEQDSHSCCWSKEFTIVIKSNEMHGGEDPGEEPVFYKPLDLSTNGEIVLSYGQSLLRYDPKTENLKVLGSPLMASFPGDNTIIRHVNSFLSLKVLGEDAKVVGPGDLLDEMYVNKWFF